MRNKILFFISVWTFFVANSYAEQNLTERSFLFLWPNQSNSDLQLDLDQPIVTDRPDFTEASSTVGSNVTQLESGYTFNYADGSEGEHREIEQTYPEFLLRRGFFKDWLEIRIGSTLSSFDTSGFSPTKFNDLYLGAKLGLVPQDGIFPEISIVPQMTVPTGSRQIGSDHTLPGANLLYAWDISEESYLGASTQFNKSDLEGDLSQEWAQSLTVGTSLSEKAGCYFEWFAFFPNNSSSLNDQHFINGGLTYLFSKDIQGDLRVGSLVDPFFDEFFMGVGLSIRFFD